MDKEERRRHNARMKRLSFFVLLFFSALSARSETVSVDMAAIEAQEDGGAAFAHVKLDGKSLFRVPGVPGHPAQKRAGEISNRIALLAGDPTRSTDTIKVVGHSGFAVVVAGDQLLLRVFDQDSGINGLDHIGYAELIQHLIGKAVLDYRQGRTPVALLKAAGLAMGVVILLTFLLIGWARFYRWLRNLTERLLKPKISKIQTKSFELLQAGLLWDGLQSVMTVLYLGVGALLIYFHLGFILRLFPWTRPLADGLLGVLLNPLKMLGLSFLGGLPGLLITVVIGLLCYAVLRTLGLFFAGIRTGTIALSGFDPDWAIPTFRIVRLAVIALAVMIAYPHIPGSNSAAFKGVSVFLGIIFSLGSSSFAANLIAGYSAIYRRAFRVGDCIEVDRFRGEVLEIQTLVTRLRTVKNEVVVIPNSVIVNSPVINYSTYAKERQLIVHTTVGIGYETPWRQVDAMLLEAAARTPGLLTDPKPFVRQLALGDFCVTYEINVYCSTPALRLALLSALHQNILDVFNENDVQIMTPAYEGDPAQPKVVPKDKWFSPLVSTESKK